MLPITNTTVDFDNCNDVAIRELIYLHDIQLLLQGIYDSFNGKNASKKLPLKLYLKLPDDVDSFVDGR